VLVQGFFRYRAEKTTYKKGIIVPLDLPECEMVSQCMGADESIEVQVRARKESAVCPKIIRMV